MRTITGILMAASQLLLREDSAVKPFPERTLQRINVASAMKKTSAQSPGVPLGSISSNQRRTTGKYLCVDAALLEGERYAIDGQHVGCDAVVDVVGFGIPHHVVEAVAQDGF